MKDDVLLWEGFRLGLGNMRLLLLAEPFSTTWFQYAVRATMDLLFSGPDDNKYAYILLYKQGQAVSEFQVFKTCISNTLGIL